MNAIVPIIPYEKHLLPHNSTPFEVALSSSGQRMLDIPTPIEDLWNPDKCPEHLLPYLAWALSVDFWNVNWSIERKRWVCRESLSWHAIKGSHRAIEIYLGLAETQLLRAIVPPQTPFWGRSTTDDERQIYLDRFAQLRVYPYRNKAPARSGLSWHWNKRAFWGHSHYVVSDAPARSGVNAYLWDKGNHPAASGEETKLRWAEFSTETGTQQATNVERIYIPGKASKRKLFWGGHLNGRANGGHFWGGEIRKARTVTVRETADVSTQSTVRKIKTVAPSTDPVDLVPEVVGEVRPAIRSKIYFSKRHKRHWGNTYWLRSNAHLRIYKKYYLYDPERSVNDRRARFYWGHFRWGMQPYHAELLVKVRGKRHRNQMYWSRGFWGQHYAHDEKIEKIFNDSLRAVRLSKSKRDKILIDTTTRRYRTWGDGVELNGTKTWDRTSVSVLK